MTILETERLLINEAQKSDASFFLELMNSPGWLEHIGDRGINSMDDALTHVAKLRAEYKKCGFGFYTMILKGSTTRVGTVGLIKRPNFAHTDIGYALLPQFEKNGYAVEAAKAMLDHGLNELSINPIWAITSLENYASQRLLKKIGLSKSGIIEWNNENVLLFSTDANVGDDD